MAKGHPNPKGMGGGQGKQGLGGTVHKNFYAYHKRANRDGNNKKQRLVAHEPESYSGSLGVPAVLVVAGANGVVAIVGVLPALWWPR
jgi:hypothetical protein